MGNDDYAPIVRGGLKLKGSTPSGIKKKKSKKDKTFKSVPSSAIAETAHSSAVSASASKSTSPAPPTNLDADKEMTIEQRQAEIRKTKKELERLQAGMEVGDEEGYGYKTPAQRKQEEMKRKRLEERFEKEGGVKTHKQRVEELNRYLSGLSEHHDMPRIGPG